MPQIKYDLLGQKFWSFTVVSSAGTQSHPGGGKWRGWNCICDCGQELICSTEALRYGLKKSCGCQRYINGNKPTKPAREVSLRNLFRRTKNSAKRRNIEFNLNLAEFEKIVFGQCLYCGSEPTTLHNAYVLNNGKLRRKNPTPQLLSGWISVNGIDRFDNKLPYTRENSVTCCGKCNNAKGDLHFYHFCDRVVKLVVYQNMRIPETPIHIIPHGSGENMPSCVRLISMSSLYAKTKTSSKARGINFCLDFYEFSKIIFAACHYCGAAPARGHNAFCYKNGKTNKYGKGRHPYEMHGAWIYTNGIDRINSDLGYQIENVVPCCTFCNYAKNTLSQNEFYDWIMRFRDRLQFLEDLKCRTTVPCVPYDDF